MVVHRSGSKKATLIRIIIFFSLSFFLVQYRYCTVECIVDVLYTGTRYCTLKIVKQYFFLPHFVKVNFTSLTTTTK